jgi:hypothetical protein
MNTVTLPEDPNLKLPAAVRAAAERSKQIFDAANRGEQMTSGDTFDGDKDDLTPLRMTVTPQPEEAEEAEVTPEGNPEPQKAEQPAPKSEPSVPDEGEDGSWEHRYHAMHGRFKKAEAANASLRDRVSSLESVIATMQTAAPASGSEKPVDLDFGDLDLTPDEMQDYGEDFLKVVGKKAKAELVPVLQKALQRVAQLEARLDGVATKTVSDAREKLHSTMDREVPNWRELNGDENFISWLGLPDPYSGGIRHDMLKAAYAAGDISRVKAFFKGFLAEEAVVAPAQPAADLPGTETVSKVPLSDLAAPGRAKTAAAQPAPAEKPIITRAQVAAFYADVAANKYRGRDAEKAKAEAMIFDAQREGRIR